MDEIDKLLADVEVNCIKAKRLAMWTIALASLTLIICGINVYLIAIKHG